MVSVIEISNFEFIWNLVLEFCFFPPKAAATILRHKPISSGDGS